MERKYYVFWYRLNGQDSYLIWFETDEVDGVFVDENGFVPAFDNIEALQKFAESRKVRVKDESPLLLDLDIVKNWLSENAAEIADYNLFLSAWNFFEDVSRSTNRNFINDPHHEIYDRIFWGCNIPAVTPDGESFTPTWTKKELKTIREIMKSGLEMFTELIKLQ